VKRYFISQHPTFGSYANPTASLVEKSPYFYWWLALTLNKKYVEFCAKPNTKSRLYRLYKDFGDVRYEGCRYKAFCDWWISKVSDDEQRGQYLFAEPLTVHKVQLIADKKTAQQLADDASSLLIAIPKNLKRSQIDKAIEKIFKDELSFSRGRKVRNPKFSSNARYHLAKPLTAQLLKVAFAIYELKVDAEHNNKKLSNAAIAKIVGLKVGYRNDEENVELTKDFPNAVRKSSYANEVRKLGFAVSRKYKEACVAVDSVLNGTFYTQKEK